VDIVTGLSQQKSLVVPSPETSKEGITAPVALGAATGATETNNQQHFYTAPSILQQQLQAATQPQQAIQTNPYYSYQQMYALQQQNLQPLGDNMINVREYRESQNKEKSRSLFSTNLAIRGHFCLSNLLLLIKTKKINTCAK